MSGLDRAVGNKFGGYTPGNIIASALRLFCEGMKVAVEIRVWLMMQDAYLLTKM